MFDIVHVPIRCGLLFSAFMQANTEEIEDSVAEDLMAAED